MSNSNSKQIKQIEIAEVASDLGINNSPVDMLAIQIDTPTINRILNKPFRSRHYSALIPEEGEINIRVNLFQYKLSPKTVLFVSPSAIKEFISIAENTKMKTVLFTEEFILNTPLDQIYRDAFHVFITNSHFFFDIDADTFSEIRQMAELLIRKSSTSTSPTKTGQLQFFAFLNSLSDAARRSEIVLPRETKSRKANLVLHFFQLLPKHIRLHRDVQFYADQLQVDAKYLSNTLKAKTGNPASAHIAYMVMLESRVMLSNGTKTINEIAMEMGFSDQFTFSKFFKLHSGMTPSTYRKL